MERKKEPFDLLSFMTIIIVLLIVLLPIAYSAGYYDAKEKCEDFSKSTGKYILEIQNDGEIIISSL